MEGFGGHGGASEDGPGSREPSPAVSAASGFDPSRDAETCQRCGGENPPWSAPSPLWNAVMRGGSINGDSIYCDMVCATCFMALAEDAGIATRWRVTAEVVNVELETVTPSGRVWDAEKWLWNDR